MFNPWIQELWRVGGVFGFLLLLGLLTGHTFICLFIACFSYLAWHLYNLHRLNRWLSRKKTFQLPDNVPGIWGEVFYHFYRLHQRNRKRKRKLANIVRRFRDSTEAMPDAAIVLGKNYEIEWINKAATHLLGFQSPQDIGQPIMNLIRAPQFCQFLTEGDKEKALQLVSPAKPDVMLKIHVIPYANKQYLLLARDITQLHRLEQVRRHFVANVSHELRTPLTVISGFIETMRDSNDSCLQHWERPLLLIAQQTSHMSSIVDDLLLLSRLETETVVKDAEPVAVADLLHNICEEARVLSGEQNHQITLEADETLALYGKSDEIRSMFTNLLSNAVRYTPAQGKIHVRWYKDDQGMHCQVSDTGEGIAPEHLPRLTERFYRVDAARSRNAGGTGLGLAIVKHVLVRHQGSLRIESVVGQGSSFYCDFPMSMSQPPAEKLLQMPPA